ncbi:hypothetical protein LTR95_006013 [Oleoguttula sp. CCFEE 5521]
MPSPKPLDQRLRRRQTDKRSRHVRLPRPITRRSSFDVPTTRRIHSKHRNFRRSECGDDRGEGFADFATEGETEDGVEDVVCFFGCGGEARKGQHPAKTDHGAPIPNVRAQRGRPPQSTTQYAQQHLQHLSHTPDGGEMMLQSHADGLTEVAPFQMRAAEVHKDIRLPIHKPTVEQSQPQPQSMPVVETVTKGARDQQPSKQSTRNNVAPAPLPEVASQHPREQMMANTSRPQTAATHVSGRDKRDNPPVPLFHEPSRNLGPLNHPIPDSSDGYASEEEPDEFEDSDLDHHIDDLTKMEYGDLKDEPFDKAPDADAFVVHNAPDDASLADKLSAVLAQTVNGNDRAQLYDYRTKFMASLTIDEWEEAGAWLVQHFGDVVQNFTGVRREKRKAAIAFESDIEVRDNAVGAKRQQIRDALDEMKVNGNAVLGTTPKKDRKESKD